MQSCRVLCTFLLPSLPRAWPRFDQRGPRPLLQGAGGEGQDDGRNKWQRLLLRAKTQVQRIKQEEHTISVFAADGWRGARCVCSWGAA